MNEVGLNAVPWATAIEVLASPEKGRVSKWHCTRLIGQHEFSDRALRWKKCWVKTNRGRRHMTLAQRIFLRLYDARSKFVHGDKVSVNLLLSNHDHGPPLLSLASTIYRTAMTAYLEEHWPLEPNLEPDGLSLRAIVEHALRESLGPYEDHLLQAIGKSYWH